VARPLIWSMGVSLDGFIADRDGKIDWSAPDEELHRFHNELAAATAVQLYGRRLYETMVFWETAEEDPERTEVERDFARIYKATPKLVFSSTLDAVEGRATLAAADPVTEVRRLKDGEGGTLACGGAGLASTLVAAGLVDEYHLFVNPVVLGGGTPFFPPLERRIPLELVETRTFGSRVSYLRYRSSG
jgi:dihydrofolate reductase